MRLAVIGLIQAPYWEPVYQGLTETAGLTVKVWFLQPKDSLRGWSGLACPYDAVQLRCWTPESWYPAPVIGVMNPGLIGHLRRFRPDCLLVHGYSYLPHLQVIRWAARTRTPCLLWGDSNSQRLTSNGVLAAGKRAWLRYFVRRAAGVLTIGVQSEAFWSHYGVESGRRFHAPLAVDNEHFASQAGQWRARRLAERRALGLGGERLLLYVGRLAAEKNLDTLLRALLVHRQSAGATLSLAVAGEGPERARLTRLAAGLGPAAVAFLGFQSQVDLPRLYGIADALVLPSLNEPWGLVVNEAMASGLPILLSRSTGCLPDLLEEGVNGFSFDEKNVNSLAACLGEFARRDDQDLARMGARSREIISRWSYAATLAGLRRALEAVTGTPLNGR